MNEEEKREDRTQLIVIMKYVGSGVLRDRRYRIFTVYSLLIVLPRKVFIP